jgi:phospholipid/cholesterol/gamma-HCH transport system substrate-binding protein
MKPRREINRLWLGAITIVVFLGFSIGVLGGAIGPQMFGGGGRTVRAIFANAQQLIPGNEVRVQGVLEGQISSVTLDPGGHSSTVTMTVPDSAGPLYRDASATIAFKTLLGGAFNVNLNRGTPSAGPLGSITIPLAHTSNQVEVDDLISVDNGGARTGLQTLPGQLASALRDPHPLTQTLSTLAHVAPAITNGVGALRGIVPDSDLRDLVSAGARTLQALNAPNDELHGLVQGLAATVAVTAARAADIRSALDVATPALQQTRTTFAQLSDTLSLADPLLRTLSVAAPQVAPTVHALNPTVVGARDLLNRAVPLLHALPPALHSLAAASRAGLPLLNGVQPSVDSLQRTILPYLNTIDPATQHTTAEMIGPTTEALGPDIAGQMDQNGHFIRFPATLGSSPFYLPCQIYAGNPSSSQLVACSSLQTILSTFLNYNPVHSLLGAAASTTGTLPLARTGASGGAARGVATVLGAVRAGLSFGAPLRTAR